MADTPQPPSSNGRNPQPMSPEDRHAIADVLVGEMSELFHGYLDGVTPFEELSFEMFDTLQTLFAIAHGETAIDYYDTDGLLKDISSEYHEGTSSSESGDSKREDDRGPSN